MIVYNVTVKIDPETHREWLDWMQKTHIPDVMGTGLFTDNRVFRLMELDETDGITYTIQYFCESMEQYLTYREEYATRLQQLHSDRFKGKFVAFRTLMRSVH